VARRWQGIRRQGAVDHARRRSASRGGAADATGAKAIKPRRKSLRGEAG
jgi:hypothetical protein